MMSNETSMTDTKRTTVSKLAKKRVKLCPELDKC
jgi:hypothetical protein